MKKFNLLLLVILFFSCRSSLITINDQTLMDFIIEDYCSSQKKYINEYQFFQIDKYIKNENCLYLYRVSPSLNNFYTPTTSFNLFDIYPTHYKVFNNKTFFWRNSKEEIPSKKMINFLDSIGLIDSSYIKYELGQIDQDSIEDHIIINSNGLESVNYIICKNKPDKIKRKIKVPSYYSYESLVKNIKCKCY